MKFFKIILYFYNLEKLNEIKKRFLASLIFFNSNTKQETADGILLVQMLKSYDFAIKLAAASKAIADKENLFVNLYAGDINWSKSERKLNSIFNFFGVNSIKKIHLPFGNKLVFKNADKYKDQQLINHKLNEIKALLGINNIEALLSLKFDDILVGDLIYDTYLRFFHQPTVESINEDIIYTIRVALNQFYNFKDYIQSNNVKILLNSYASYIQHGIPARICIHNKIKVYTIGSTSYVMQKMTKEFPYHQINHMLFDPQKILLPEQFDRAKKQLEIRFTGGIDPATSYMRQSAYGNSKTSDELKAQFALKPRNIVIYAHDFFDSPHTNRQLQFPDLYQFLKQTLQALTELNDTTVFIKTHPNGIDGCKEITIDMVAEFNRSHFIILNESVSNLNIIELKPDLIGTARGTIGIEMAYWGIPTVALFDNLYANFNFVHTCMNTEAYFAILKGEKLPQIDFDKQKIFSFYYQAFLEQRINEEHNIFSIFDKFKGLSTYSDDYLNFIFSTEYMANRQKLVDCYNKIL